MSRFRHLRRTIAAGGALGLLVLGLVALLPLHSARAAAMPDGSVGGSFTTIPLSNDTAAVSEDCPTEPGAFWHFVISPNNGESYFIEFHLNLGDTDTYDTTMFVPNGTQLDNVFVEVPAGKQLDSLIEAGSSADIHWSGDGPEPGAFRLSHLCPGTQDLTVAKTAAASYTRTFDWAIDKTADRTTVYSAGGGESEPVEYTVDVTKGDGVDSDWTVTGEITVTNPNAMDVTDVALSDATPGGTCEATPGVVDVPAHDTVTVDYTCTFAANPGSGTNTVTATWPDIGSESTTATATADFTFGDPTTVVNDAITVEDSNGATWMFSESGSQSYSETYADPAGTCTEHVNTATITETDQTASATVEDCQGADLTVEKTAEPTYDLTYAWDIAKGAAPDTQTVDAGQPATFDYAVKVTHDEGTASNWAVAGTITVANPNDWQDITADVSDALPDADCTVDGGAQVVVPQGGSVALPYACTLTGAIDGTNTATVTWDAGASHTPSGSAEATRAFAFGNPTSIIDECHDVTDTVAGNLGTTCVGEDNPRTFTYQGTFPGPAAGTCADQPNTATGTTNDSGATGSASATVEVCSYAPRLTPGYWKNHLVVDGSNPDKPYVQVFLAQTLGTYAVDSTTKASAVWKAMNCSNSGNGATLNQNAIGCLAGHLLAAKLNVANGSNPCIGTTITAADGFLTGIPYTGPSGNYAKIGVAKRAEAISLKNALDAYNNGTGCH